MVAMSPEQWERVKACYEEASSLRPQEREGVLDRHCGDDPVLRSAVEALLNAPQPPRHFLDTPFPGILHRITGDGDPPFPEA